MFFVRRERRSLISETLLMSWKRSLHLEVPGENQYYLLVKQVLIGLNEMINKCSIHLLQRNENPNQEHGIEQANLPFYCLNFWLINWLRSVPSHFRKFIGHNMLHPHLLPKSPSWFHLPSHSLLIPSSIIIITPLQTHLVPLSIIPFSIFCCKDISPDENHLPSPGL